MSNTDLYQTMRALEDAGLHVLLHTEDEGLWRCELSFKFSHRHESTFTTLVGTGEDGYPHRAVQHAADDLKSQCVPAVLVYEALGNLPS